MNEDFIGTDEYDNEIFDHVLILQNNKYWKETDNFMAKEYGSKWIRYRNANRVL